MRHRWQSDPGLRRLVAERREGDLSRRAFLGVLGGTTAGAALGATVRPARAQKKVVVTMWDTEPNPATRAAVKAIVDDFHKLHKDIEIRAEGMGWGDMDRKLQAAMAAKSPPTASHTQTYVVTSFRAKGLIEPMDDVVKAIGEDKIFPSILQWIKYPDGKYWGLTHAWGAEILGGRGDYLQNTGVNPASWKTWDDWLRDLPKLNKAPQYYGLSLAGIPFFVNEDVYMWTGSNGGSLFDDKGNPALESPQVLGMLEFWRKLKPFMPPGWASHDYLETLSAWATGKTAQVLMWGRTTGYIDQYAPPDKRNPDVFQVWPKTTGPLGKAPLTQFDNEPWVIYSDAPADEKAACREFLKFFFKRALPELLQLRAPAPELDLQGRLPGSQLPGAGRPQAVEALARCPAQVGGIGPRAPAPGVQSARSSHPMDRRRGRRPDPGRHGHGRGGARQGSTRGRQGSQREDPAGHHREVQVRKRRAWRLVW